MTLEMLLREIEMLFAEAEHKSKQFSDEEATEVISCKICLINTTKVIFTSCYHSPCFSCVDKLQDFHMCWKTI